MQQCFRMVFGANNVQVNSPSWLLGHFNLNDVNFGYNGCSSSSCHPDRHRHLAAAHENAAWSVDPLGDAKPRHGACVAACARIV